jgi:hypothetical protein
VVSKIKDQSFPLTSGDVSELRCCLEAILIRWAQLYQIKNGLSRIDKGRIEGPDERKTIVLGVLAKRKHQALSNQQDSNRLVVMLVNLAYARASNITHKIGAAQRREVDRIINLIEAALFELLDL